MLRFIIALCAFGAAWASAATPPAAIGDTWVVLASTPDQPRITWTPSASQVLAARSAARIELRRLARAPAQTERARCYASQAREILAKWRSYRLQGYGITDKHRRIIYLNFVTPLTPIPGVDRSWRDNEVYDVSDGGNDYWQAEYDPITRKILGWQPNGLG